MNYSRNNSGYIEKFAIIIVGAVLGAIAAVLFAMGLAPNIDTLLIATTVIGLVFSVFLANLPFRGSNKKHNFRFLPLTLSASLTLLALSVLLLATAIIPSIIFAVFVFFLTAAFFILIIGLFAMVNDNICRD